jgi:ABC-type dipeptide/oligopeptide/nickel transport system ATPase subunit
VTASIKRTRIVQGLIASTGEQPDEHRKHQLRSSVRVVGQHRASTMTVLRNIARMAGAAVDRHRHRDVRRAQVEAVIKDAHVVERGDRHRDAPTLPLMSGRRSGSRP